MILLLLAAAAQTTAVDAERAFADMAQKRGQWTAFRAYAAPRALMFVPGPRNALDWLKGRKDPPASVHWWPSRSWVSCDGTTAVNIGPALYGANSHGTFTTVWNRQKDGGWKWLLDQGHRVPNALAAAEKPKLDRASCRGRPNVALVAPRRPDGVARPIGLALAPGFLVLEEGRQPSSRPSVSHRVGSVPIASGSSPDGTLYWHTQAIEGASEGGRVLQLFLWDGRAYRLHLTDIHEGRRP